MRWIVFLVLLLAGCDQSPVADARDYVSRLFGRSDIVLPPLGPASIGEDGIAWHHASSDHNGTVTQLMIALPDAVGPFPVVLWAPLSMNWKLGGELGQEDQQQMYLFASAGVGVVAYSVPGGWEDNATLDQLEAALDRFMDADGGLTSGLVALEFAAANIPGGDADRIWSSGDGLGGTLALRLAQADRRVRAVVAFDPVTDMASVASSEDMSFLAHLRPGLRDFIISISPRSGLDRLQCPVLLYHDTLGHEQNFPSLSDFYLECLRRQKDVFLMDNIGIDPEYTGYSLRTSRAMQWLEGLGREK